MFNFESLYEKYPRKRGKTVGLKRLPSLIKSQKDFDALSRAIDNYARSVTGKEPQFILYFSSFISQWREWVDIVDENKAKSSVHITPIDLKDIT